MFSILLYFCAILNTLHAKSIWMNPYFTGEGVEKPIGLAKPWGPGGPFGIGGPYGPGGPFGPGGPYRPGGPYGSWGPYGPGGPYGPRVPYGPGGPNQSLLTPRGLFGLGMFGPFGGVHQQVLSTKFKPLSSMATHRREYLSTVLKLNSDLKLAKAELESDLDVLNSSVEQVKLEAEAEGKDISQCVSAYQASSEEITAKINDLDLDVGKTELGKNISKSIGSLKSQIGIYWKIVSECKLQYPSTQTDDIQQCITSQKEPVDLQVDTLESSIREDINDLQVEITTLIDETTVQVKKLIEKSQESFNQCSS